MSFQIRRGTTAQIIALTTGENGEPLWSTDDNALYIVQGATPYYIGGAQRWEFAQIVTGTNSSVNGSHSETTIQWDTASGSNLNSDSDIFTLAADGITVATTGYYRVTASLQLTCSTSFSADIAVPYGYITLDGTKQAVKSASTYMRTATGANTDGFLTVTQYVSIVSTDTEIGLVTKAMADTPTVAATAGEGVLIVEKQS